MTANVDETNEHALPASRGPWVRLKPAVSFVGAGPGFAVVTALGRAGVRAVTVDREQPSVPSRHDGRLPQTQTGLITALFDTSITVVGSPVRANARMLGLILALKSQYHAALILGSELDPALIAYEIETASGRTVGPDFGLCCDPSPLISAVTSDAPRVLQASDRRAFTLVATFYAALKLPVCCKSFNLR